MIINTIYQGGAALNFEVVGGTTAPAAPKENTIWVNTDAAITSWVFAADAPSSPTEGMVWLTTSTSSPTAFNAVKKNGLWVYPSAAQQYIDGEWESKTAKTWQGGEWVDWWNGELYSNGNEYASITGGWSGRSDTGYYYAGTFSKTAATMVVRKDGRAAMYAVTNNMVDLTKFTTLTFKMSAVSTGGGNPRYLVTTSYTPPGTEVVGAYTSTKTVTLDVTNVNQPVYIAAGVLGESGNSSITITEIYLT